jgi:hypothetical protein
MESKQRLAKRARIYDQIERASDHGIGHPPGPTGWRKPRAPPATGNAAKLRRLRKLHPELHARVMSGELTVGKAATMAGFHTPKKPKPVVERTISRLQEQELWLGRSQHGSTFASDEERRSLWFEHRDRLMQLFANNGRRPQAWWKFEAPFTYPGFNQEKSTLWAAGLLGAAEARTLEEDWRQEFDRSLAPGFTFNDGPRGVLTGWEAHIAHLVSHDVPADLAEQWAAFDDAA